MESGMKGKRFGSTKPSKSQRNVSLHDQLIEDKSVRSVAREKKRRRRDDDDEYVGSKESKRILKQAKDQLVELEGETNTDEQSTSCKRLKQTHFTESESEEEEDDEIFRGDEPITGGSDDMAFEEEPGFLKNLRTDSDRQKLADDVLDVISSKRTELCSQVSDVASVRSQISDDLVKLFKGVGQVLSHHRSGPVPKPLKIIPKYKNWEELLDLTEPDRWSAAAVRDATRIFVSNLKEDQAGKFMNIVLLPRIRDDIREFKRLNDHLYEALIKCMFKSYGFMKGFLLPLCKSGDCTLKEATIIASVLAKSSIKMEHSAAAMMEIAQMPYSGANCIFLTALIDKKYALPFIVVDELVNYFLRFLTDKQDLTTLWHQCLLVFVQRLKEDLSSEQKEALLELLKVHPHPGITPEVRRELVNAKCRDVEMTEPTSSAQPMVFS